MRFKLIFTFLFGRTHPLHVEVIKEEMAMYVVIKHLWNAFFLARKLCMVSSLTLLLQRVTGDYKGGPFVG